MTYLDNHLANFDELFILIFMVEVLSSDASLGEQYRIYIVVIVEKLCISFL